MTAIAETNGHHAPTLDDEREAFDRQLDAQIDSMRALLAEQRSLTRHLQAQLDEHKAREKRIEKALNALQGETSATSAPRPARKAQPSDRKRYASAEAIEATFAALAELGGERRQSELCEVTGLSTPTISQSLRALREAERVRVARVEGASRYYAPMPEVGGVA